ncbi:MAG: hypothetical protein K6A30_00745 [Lachnospiraceae bacterium]|nr:hypothetical protein [Lachnospiraceae bacterium]
MEIGKIYFDMDGVLADFESGIRTYCHMEPVAQSIICNNDDLWAAVKKVDHFYLQLKPYEGAVEMFMELYREYGHKVEILSGIPRARRGIVTARQDKIDWVHKYLSPDVKCNIVYREEKQNYCTGPQDILIDDFDVTIEQWESKGGSGICHVSIEDTKNKIRQLKQQ